MIFRGKFSIILLPREWSEKLNLGGGTLLTLLFITQLVGVFRPARTIAYMDHLVGMVVGVSSALWWRENQQRKMEAQKKNLWDRLVGWK